MKNKRDEVVIIGVYINSDEQFEHDISELEIEINKYPEDKLVVIGDFNSDLNRNRSNDKKLKHFLNRNELKVASYEYTQKIPYTFKSMAHKNGGHSRIDHIVISQKTRVEIEQININYDTETMEILDKQSAKKGINPETLKNIWEHNNYSDHRSLTIEIKTKTIIEEKQTNKTRTNESTTEQTVNWNNKEVIKQYQKIINEKLKDKKLNEMIANKEDMTEAINRLHSIMKDATKEISETRIRNINRADRNIKNKQEWDAELQEISNEKTEYYIKYIKTNNKSHLDKHKYLKKLMRTKLRQKRRMVDEGLGKLLQKQYQTNLAKFWSMSKRKLKPEAKTELNIPTITKHFEKVFNEKHSSNDANTHKINEQTKKEIMTNSENISIKPEQIQAILLSLPNNKAIGHSGTCNEMFKYAAETNTILAIILARIFGKIINNMIVPSILNISMIIPVIKDEKGDMKSTNNIRPISISDTIASIFEKLALAHVNETIEDNSLQFGFKENSSCNHAIFIAKETIIHNMRKNKPTYAAVIDFRRAFDSTNREKLFQKLGNKMKDKMWLALYNYYEIAQAYVVKDKQKSEMFSTTTGVKQGGPLSPKLFSTYVEDLINELKNSESISEINGNKTGIIMFADDTLILSDSPEELRQAIETLENYCKENDILINASKSQFMIFGPKKHRDENINITINNEKIEKVDKVKYLGVHLNNTLNNKHHLNTKQLAMQRAS